MTFLQILAILLAVIGIVGSVVPGLPGPPVSWLGVLCAYFCHGTNADGNPMSLTLLFVLFVITAIITILDYIIPAFMTKTAGGHKAASIGAIVGLFAGMFFTPVGMIGGSLIGAFLGEFLIEDAGVWDSFKASLGAFAGFICGTLMKLVCSAVMAYYIIVFCI